MTWLDEKIYNLGRNCAYDCELDDEMLRKFAGEIVGKVVPKDYVLKTDTIGTIRVAQEYIIECIFDKARQAGIELEGKE